MRINSKKKKKKKKKEDINFSLGFIIFVPSLFSVKPYFIFIFFIIVCVHMTMQKLYTTTQVKNSWQVNKTATVHFVINTLDTLP